jgi:glycosyltransferase involved in cell wall biosynthesis
MSSSRPLVTIMIPTYNQADVVAHAIESALAQTYDNLEVVVADDASTDGTAAVVARYSSDPRLRYCRNELRLGRVGNYRRTLYTSSRGTWALNVDGDDYLTDVRFVEDAIDAVGARDDVVMVSAGYRVLLNDGRSKVDIPTSVPVQEVDGVELFLRPFGEFAAGHLSTLYRRDIAMQIGFYRFDIASADRESLWRLALHGRAILLGRPIGVWRIHGDNTILKLSAHDVTVNMKAILEPYAYALSRGIDRRRLDLWRDRSLAAYVVSHAPLVAQGGFKEAMSVLQCIRVHRRAYWLAVARLMSDPRAMAKWVLLGAGGRRGFLLARTCWQRLTWDSRGTH